MASINFGIYMYNCHNVLKVALSQGDYEKEWSINKYFTTDFESKISSEREIWGPLHVHVVYLHSLLGRTQYRELTICVLVD